MAEAPKRIAAIITSFWRMSHAEVIVGRLLEGYYYQGERQPPRVKIVSMYVDQFPENDMSREIAAKHNIPIHASIEAALQMGGEDLAVDGVVIIGEYAVCLSEIGNGARDAIDHTANRIFSLGRIVLTVEIFADHHGCGQLAPVDRFLDVSLLENRTALIVGDMGR